MVYFTEKDLIIRSMEPLDAAALGLAFADQHKPREQFERYYSEQLRGARRVIIAVKAGETAGYVTLLPEAATGPFQGMCIPEIADFNVLKPFQRQGIGKAMMDVVEGLASETCDRVSLGVGLHSGYGTAQRMYVKRGYIPDGSGVWYRDRQLTPYTACVNDDDLVLYMMKALPSQRPL